MDILEQIWANLYNLQTRSESFDLVEDGGDFDVTIVDNTVLIAGIQDKEDFWIATNVQWLQFGDGAVLEGAFRSLAKLFPSLRQLMVKDQPYSFAGYSFGGVLASLIASQWLRRGGIVRDVFSFASPRCFDLRAALSYDLVLGKNTLRFSFVDDPVGHLPILGGYHHGRSFVFDSDGNIGHSQKWEEAVSLLGYDSKLVGFVNWVSVGMGAVLLSSKLRHDLAKNHDIDRYDRFFKQYLFKEDECGN